MEAPVLFDYGGHPVHGILHTPEDRDAREARIGVLMVNPGLRSRFGPQRQYVRFARQLCADGFVVLRFDIPGVGDSAGELQSVPEYRQLAGDPSRATAAIDYLRQETGVERVGLAGLCTGAYTALCSGHGHPMVDFALLLGLPVNAVGDGVKPTAQPSRSRLGRYFRRALQLRRWLNPSLFASNVDALRRFFGGMTTDRDRWSGYEDSGLWDKIVGLSTGGKRLLFVFGELDHEYRAFQEQITGRLEQLDRGEARYAVQVIGDGDHSLSKLAWQDEAFAVTTRWLREQFVAL